MPSARHGQSGRAPGPRVALAACLLGLAATGCVKRTLLITSEPSGALVTLNDQEIGRTPATIGFTYYGIYDVRLTKRGYEPLSTTGDTHGPLWELPGPDLIAEAIPNAQNTVHWHYALLQVPPPDSSLSQEETQRLKRAATTLRSQVVAPDIPANR